MKPNQAPNLSSLILILVFMTISFSSCYKNQHNQVGLETIREQFSQPPRESGVNCWWWWLNGNVTKATITKDLEAMASRNFQGAMIFDAGGHNQRGNKDIPDGPMFGSHEWNDLFVFALDEAKRLQLEIGFNIQSGWNLGGPRVTPKYAAKQITYSKTRLSGGKRVEVSLSVPPTRSDFYHDIAVLALPAKSDSSKMAAISDLSLKMGFRELGGSAPDCRFLLTNQPRNPDRPELSESSIYYPDEIISLIDHMSQEGILSWDAPPGEWIVVRIGYTITDAHVSTSSNQWQGLVLDYMSKEAFDYYWSDVVAPILKAAGEHVGTTLKYMETDSWECGGMNWTDHFADEFLHYRGYEITPYLPILAGFIIENTEHTNAFLADFRKTLGDLVAYNHYARFAEKAHEQGMGIQPESAGPHAGPMDGIKNYGFSDIVMSEFWSPSPHRPKDENRFFLKQASSAAHIYGKKIIGAESFTTIGPHWNDELWHDQKSAFDHEICAGLNRLYFHTFTASPAEMGLPGQEYFAGTHINPQVTWWDYSKPFIDYLHRVQSVVQNGRFVADVLYYYGDHVPNIFGIKASDPAGALPGFDYDVCDEITLLKLEVSKGQLVSPGNTSYRILVLPDHRVLSFAALMKIEELLKQGATIIGHKPERMVSLSGGFDSKTRFAEISDRIWGPANNETGEKKYESGTIAWGITAREYLLNNNILPDFMVLPAIMQDSFDYIHYQVDQRDVYFISNQSVSSNSVTFHFRSTGNQPQLWDPLTGSIKNAGAYQKSASGTAIPLTLEPYGSVFVVFGKPSGSSKNGTEEQNQPHYTIDRELTGSWKVRFDPKLGGPGEVVFEELTDWSVHPDPGIRYYSGKATYVKTFDYADLQVGKQYHLQLNTVKDVGIAEVLLNGQYLGIQWTKPFRTNITGILKEGSNEIEITIVNSWYNRVAGDETGATDHPITSTNIILGHDFRGWKLDSIPLEPSGLLGPVQIMTSKH